VLPTLNSGLKAEEEKNHDCFILDISVFIRKQPPHNTQPNASSNIGTKSLDVLAYGSNGAAASSFTGTLRLIHVSATQW